MSKLVTIQIQGRCFNINTEDDENYLHKIAAQFDVLINQAARLSPNSSAIDQLVMVGLEQQDQICCLHKQVAELKDKLDHYDVGEGLGCIANYRESITMINQKADALQRENDSLRAQLDQTFDALAKLTKENTNKDRKDSND